MKHRILYTAILIIFVVLVGIFLWRVVSTKQSGTGQINSENPQSLNFDQSISDGSFTIKYPSSDFGLAVNRNQIPVKSYIPPCDQNFNYCLYYNNTEYQGTNFESAGIRIQKRTDLGTERLCLETPPQGYDASVQSTLATSTDLYSSSIFANLSDAAAGHYANSLLYRYFVRKNSSCYELETRIGQSQFGNYPAGSIKEFTQADQSALQSELNQIVNTFTIDQ